MVLARNKSGPDLFWLGPFGGARAAESLIMAAVFDKSVGRCAAIARGIPRFCVTGSSGERPALSASRSRVAVTIRESSAAQRREVNDQRDNTGSDRQLRSPAGRSPARSSSAGAGAEAGSKVALLRNCEHNRVEVSRRDFYRSSCEIRTVVALRRSLLLKTCPLESYFGQ